MTQPITDDDLHGYVDDALPARRRQEVAAYLEEHPDVARRFSAYAAHRDELRAALRPIADEPVPARLNPSHIAERRRKPFGSLPNVAAAAALLLTGLASGWAIRGPDAADRTGVRAVANEASYAYETFGTDRSRAIEIPAAQSADLVGWIGARLNRPVIVPDLKRVGCRFMGGRIVATGNGPAGLLLYEDLKGERIGVLMRPMRIKDREADMTKHHEGGLLGYAWADDGMGYSLVGPAGVSGLHPLANEVRRQFLSAT